MSTHTDSDGAEAWPDNPDGRYRMDETEWYDGLDEHPGHRDDADREYGQHHDFSDGVRFEAWLAHKILKRTGTLVCSRTLYDDPAVTELEQLCRFHFEGDPTPKREAPMHVRNHAVELSEPAVRPPKAAGDAWGLRDYRQTCHRKRITERYGYLSGGLSTGVVVQDRPVKQFMAIVDVVLGLADRLESYFGG